MATSESVRALEAPGEALDRTGVPRSLEEITRLIDGWRVLSEMPLQLAWFIPFAAGCWRLKVPYKVLPIVVPDDEWTARHRTMEQWSDVVAELVVADRHTAWRAGLEAWLGSVYAEVVHVRGGFAEDGARRLGRRVADIWPRLDEVPAFVGYELALAVVVAAEEGDIFAATRRLAPKMAPRAWRPDAAHGVDTRWLKRVARTDAVLAIKIGAEAALRTSMKAGRRIR